MKILPEIEDVLRTIKREYCGRKIRATDSIIYLTYRCTSRCKTCNIWKRNSDNEPESELGWNGWKRVLDNIKDYGIQTVEIFGGDALLRKNLIYRLIDFCSTNGIRTFFPTNSLLLDRETAERLVDSGLDVIYFSLDGIDSTSDEVRGRSGTFGPVRAAIENLCSLRKNNKPSIVVCTTISSLNYAHFPEIVRFLGNYRIDGVYPRLIAEFEVQKVNNSAISGIKPEPYFTSSNGASHLLKPSEAGKFLEIINELRATEKNTYVNYRSIDTAGLETLTKGLYPHKKCLICSTLLTIDPFGNVTPCPMYNNYIIGNLLEKPMNELWGNEKHQCFIQAQRMEKIEICRNCNLCGYHPNILETCDYYIKRAFSKGFNKLKTTLTSADQHPETKQIRKEE